MTLYEAFTGIGGIYGIIGFLMWMSMLSFLFHLDDGQPVFRITSFILGVIGFFFTFTRIVSRVSGANYGEFLPNDIDPEFHFFVSTFCGAIIMYATYMVAWWRS